MSKVFEKLRNFDAYPKPLEDARIQTFGGATISVISVIIMFVLFFIEFVDYMQPNVSEELFVDTSRSPNIQINLDIIVPRVSCDFLALDAMDSSGEQHLEIDHNIYKRRLDINGIPIDTPKKEDITVKHKNEVAVANETSCGSCYGAALDPKRCCNTCDEVRTAYRERQWSFPINPENITQCKNEKVDEKLKLAFKQGCQIYGSLIVNRVSGSFHIAPGKSFSINHVHVHDVQPFSSTEFNTTHKIRHLSFGERIMSETHDPLKDTVGLAEEGATMFQYYIKIVPTQYVNGKGEVINSNQFSVTKHKKVVSITSGESGMPGIFFQYELAPLMVKYTEKARSLAHFLTNVCAIIGGVFTVAGLIDSFFFHTARLIQKKFELGKLH
ncbi:hypothetical protein HHI36_004205 [Cryptolaemus montrouzieri]|uniref:Endoplasmic reticulum-Golgi intermediate compartment protein 3 n=1 Tax=Cryptolaemus montrouzieri TaxID=559131 RepID=A0ABD2NQQ5_9CUCU